MFKERKLTKGTLSIRKKNGNYSQLWYVNSDGYPKKLGKEILENLKTPEDIKQAYNIFTNAKCDSHLETDLVLGDTESIEPILRQYNDYSYVLDEETGKWGFYKYNINELHDLEDEIKKN